MATVEPITITHILPPGFLNDRGIEEAIINQEIVIDHNSSDSFTPVGYDLRIGKDGWIWTKKDLKHVNIDRDGFIRLKPGAIALITTMEDVRLSSKISGTIHAKVSLSALGFSVNPTTVDPTWGNMNGGLLLIQITNTGLISLDLKKGEPFCTILFSRTLAEAKRINKKSGSREDIIQRINLLMEDRRKRTRQYRFMSFFNSKLAKLLTSIVLGYFISFCALLLSMTLFPITAAEVSNYWLAGGASLSAGIMAVLVITGRKDDKS